MTENTWKKISHTFGLLPLAALFAIVAYYGHLEIKDLDLWLHLAVGKFITIHGYVPDVDFLSHTIAGRPWDNHEWLFQVIVYNIFANWSFPGLQYMQSTLVTATMLVLLLIGYSREKQTIMTFVLILVFLVFQYRFTYRPDLFSLFFFSIYIYLLSTHIDKKWVLGALVLIQVLWVNMHGFFFFGPLFCLIGVLSEWIKRNVRLPAEWSQVGNLTDDEYGRLKWAFVFVCLACLLNPGFVRGAIYPLGVFFSLGGDSQIFFKYIQELKKPIVGADIWDTSRHFHYKILIFLSGLSFIANRRRIDISALIIWIVFLIFSLKAVRNTAYFSFAAYLVILNNVYGLDGQSLFPIQFSRARFKYMTSAIIKLFMLIWLLQFADGLRVRGYYDFDKYERKDEFGGVSQRTYPDKAVDFLVEQGIKGNFFNDFNSGAYLLGRTFPDIKVYIDGRTEVYGAEYFKRYWKIHNQDAYDLFLEDVEKYNMTGVLLNSASDHIPRRFLKSLYEDPEWLPVYFDYDGIVFLKDVPQNKAWIDENYIDLEQWEPIKLDLIKLGSTSLTPYRNFYRAYSLESMGLLEQAYAEVLEALRVDPGYSDALGLAGKILAKQKMYREAYERFRVAVMYTPNKKEARYNLAMIYMDLNEYEYSIEQFKKIITLWPAEPKAYFLAAKAYILNGDYGDAMRAVELGLKYDIKATNSVAGLGDLMLEEGKPDFALTLFNTARELNPGTDDIFLRTGKAYAALDDRDKAAQFYEEGLKRDPQDSALKKALNELNDSI